MSVCPNTNSEEWKNLVALHGERGAYRKWLENGKEIPGITNMSMGNIGSLITQLQKHINMNVILNSDMNLSGRVIKKGDEHVIEINPNLLQSDTIIHEFGHVYIDLLGGMNNPVIKAGVARLRGSELENFLKKKYPDLEGERFDKELLATAIGKEGVEIWKNNSEKASTIANWIQAFFRNLRNLIGINGNVAKELASQLLEDRVNQEALTGRIEEELYEQRTDSEASKVAARRQKLADKALGVISSKLELLKRNIDRSNEGQAAVYKELTALKKSLEKQKVEKALPNFVRVADHQISTILEKFEEYIKNTDKVNARTIDYLRSAMLAFDLDFLETIVEDLTEEQADIRKVMDTIVANQSKALKLYDRLSRKFITENNTVIPTKIDAKYRRKAELEFNKKFRDLDKSSRAEKLKDYTEQYLEDNKDKIENEIEANLDSLFSIISKDVSFYDLWVSNPKDLDSDIIRTVINLIDKTDYKILQTSLDEMRKIEKYYNDFVEYVGKHSDQKKQYESILEKDNTGILPILAKKGSATWKEIKTEGGKYKGTPVETYYDFVTTQFEKSDERYPPNLRLNGKLPVLNKNTFERIAESGIFTAIKEGTLDIFKLRKEDIESGALVTEEAEKAKASLDSTVTVLSTQAGEEKKIIPVHFRGKIDNKDRSFDITSLLVVETHQSINYQEKRNIQVILEMMLTQTKKAEVEQRSGIAGRLKTFKDGTVQTKKGDSNVSKALESILENRLYGIRMTGDPHLNKIVSSVKGYFSIVTLFANYLSAGANFNQGMAMVFMEGVGAQFYTTKDVFAAAAKYTADNAGVFLDANSRQRSRSKTNLLLELLNGMSNTEILENSFSKNDILKRNLNIGKGLALNKMAEHAAQSIGMYSVLNNIKVKDAQGNFLTKDGTTTDRSKAMSFDEAYSVGYQHAKTGKTISAEAFKTLTESQKGDYIDGVLHLDERVASTERSKDLDTFSTSQVVRRVNRALFGNYDANNKALIERYALGSLLTHMRGWIDTGIKKRWRGGNTLFLKEEGKFRYRPVRNTELRDVDLHFNMETQEFEEGMYVSTLRYITSILQDVKALKFKVMSENWKDLTSTEKQNIRRTLAELGMIAAAIIAVVVLDAALDDDDDEVTLLTAFYARRLLNELMTYMDPGEWQRTFRSPAITLSFIESILDASWQTLVGATEEYEKGRHKGQNKALTKWLNITPAKALDRDMEYIESALQFQKR